MRKITIFISENVPLSSFAIPFDVFRSAGGFWNALFKKPPEPVFDIQTVTIDGNPVKTIDGLEIKPDDSINNSQESDMIIITPAANPLNFPSHEAVPWLKQAHDNGTHISSICTGAFLLAETGLLDNKTATTHWGFVKDFQNLYPDVILKPDKLITDEGDLYCSGGANAGGDLSLYLLGKYLDKELAFQTARALVMDMDRKSQSPYMIFRFEKSHGDEEILNIQKWIENNFNTGIRINRLAQKAGMSRRTFERRFKNATGDSPLQYVQRVRIESAKQLLAKGSKTFDEITYHVGYEDRSTFGRVFKKSTGLSPHVYKNKYTF